MVEKLARTPETGLLGLWTYRPARFSDLRVSSDDGMDIPQGEIPSAAEGSLDTWFVEGYGAITCEPNGVINLNRYLPMSLGEARLTRRFEIPERVDVTFEFGFSDSLALMVDGQMIFSGEHKFRGFADRKARGYVEPGMQSLRRMLAPGVHRLTAVLRVTESFGWGLALAAHGEGLRWLPVEFGVSRQSPRMTSIAMGRTGVFAQ